VKAMNGLGTTLGDTTVNEKAGYVLVQQTFDNHFVLNVGYRLEHHNVSGTNMFRLPVSLIYF
jgi:hypothetical protein